VDGDGEYYGPWGNCDRNCKEERPIKCYQKLAEEDGEPDLRYCRYTDDLCVYAFLKHEDGLHHSNQYCANSTEETWWRGDREPCRYGNEGGYQCACRQSGCILMRKLLVIFLWRPDSRCFFFLFLFLSWLSSFLSSAASVAAGKRVLQRTTFTLSHPNIILHQLLMDQGDRGG